MTQHNIVSLFCGAGGMDFGAHDAGFHTSLALDYFEASTSTFKRYFQDTEVVTGDIFTFNNSKKNPYPRAEVLMGGYPCQSFSMGGARDPAKDERSNLFLGFADAVSKIKPKIFIAENVSGLTRLNNGEWLKRQIEVYERQLSVKYNVHWRLLNAADYGVPQFRKRVFIVGVRNDISDSFEFPEPTHASLINAPKIGLLPYKSHGEAIKHLAPNPIGEYYERPNDPEGNFAWYFMSRNRRHRWDSPAFTVVANYRHMTLHPASPKMELEWSDLENGWKQKWRFSNEYDHTAFCPKFPCLKPRRLSWREAAAIQTFPKGFRPDGTLAEKFEQIGNAVPPKLMEKIMRRVKEML